MEKFSFLPWQRSCPDMRIPLERLSCKVEETLKGIPPEVRHTEQFSANRFIFAAGAFSLFRCVAVGLIVIAMSGFLVIKGKFAYISLYMEPSKLRI